MCLVLLLYHAGSAPLDFNFGLVAKYILLRIILSVLNKSKQASCAEMVLGSFFFYARVVQQLGFWTQKVQANVVYCYVRRRAEYLSLIHI